MPTNFPTNIDSYTTKVNNVDTIAAGHVNDLQDAMVQVETIFGAGAVRRTSWTPTLRWETAGTSSWTYTTRTGFYARFGSMAFINCYLVATATLGTASGQLFIEDLPFVPVSGGHVGQLSIGNCVGFNTYPTNAAVWFSAAQIRLFRSTNNSDTLTTAHVTTGATLHMIISGWYFHA